MKMINKNNNRVYEVYDVAYDSKGYPHFLIYDDGQWKRMSAKHFVPCLEMTVNAGESAVKTETNADHIREMNDKELAELLLDAYWDGFNDRLKNNATLSGVSSKDFVAWLQDTYE